MGALRMSSSLGEHKTTFSEGFDMARDRIELPTRGFSVVRNKKPARPTPQTPNKPKGIIPPITLLSLGVC
jgi:hypothetical protein